MKTLQYFDGRSNEWSDLYDDDPRFARRYSRIVDLITQYWPNSGTAALDAGCGSGVFSRTLAARGMRVTAFDGSSQMIKEAMAHISDNIEYHRATIEEVPVMQGRYDVVLSLSMLEYVNDANLAIAKLCSGLKTNGILILSVPNARGLLRWIEKGIYGIRIVSGNRMFSKRGEYLKYQKHQWSAMKLDKILASHGFLKQRGIFLNSGFDLPDWAQIILEDSWWAGMYCAVYRKA